MKDDYAPRVHITLPGGTRVEHPPELPELVHMDDPATFVLIDFASHRPTTVSPDISIDAAMSKIRASGAHLLLVTDDEDAVIGQISSCDIMGEAPVRLAVANGISHDEITVSMLMTPRDEVMAMEWSHIPKARVGHIVATLHHLECCSLLVVEDGRIRGMFCANEITRHLGHEISDTMMCAHSLADIVHEIG